MVAEYTIYVGDEVYQTLRFRAVAMENAKVLTWLQHLPVKVIDDTGATLYRSPGRHENGRD